MKPILVDQCNHYNTKTHHCDRCGRGLPDVCLEFEEMKRKAEAYEQSTSKAIVNEEDQDTETLKDDTHTSDSLETQQVQQEPKKTRGRRRKVTSETNITD